MRKIIEGPADWRGADLRASTDWIHEFTSDEIAEIENALCAAKVRRAPLNTLTKEDFPLPTVWRRIEMSIDPERFSIALNLFHCEAAGTNLSRSS